MIKPLDYFYFPIEVLRNITSDTKGKKLRGVEYVLNDALKYALYAKYLSLAEQEENRFDERAYNQVLGEFDLKKHADPSGAVEEWKRAYNRYKGAKEHTRINNGVYWLFESNLKTDFEIIQLLAYLSLRSIIGHSQAKAIAWRYMLSRMTGRPKNTKFEQLPKWVKQYDTRRKREKLLNALINHWGLNYLCPKGCTLPWYCFCDVETLEFEFIQNHIKRGIKVPQGKPKTSKYKKCEPVQEYGRNAENLSKELFKIMGSI